MATEYTKNFGLAKPDFRSIPWTDQINGNSDLVDSVLFSIANASQIVTWANSTHFAPGALSFDTLNETTWLCLIEHTSPATGTFEDYRAAHPTHWKAIVNAFTPRGAWANDTDYHYWDHTYDSALGIVAICTAEHTSNSSGDIRDDAANWVFVVDFSTTGAVQASAITYDNTASDMDATNVQDALDEHDTRLDNAAIIVQQHETRLDDVEEAVDTLETTVTAQGTTLSGLSTAVAGKAPSSRAVATSGLATGGGDLSQDRTIAVTPATAAEIIAKSSNKAIGVDNAWAAGDHLVNNSASGALTLDFNVATRWTLTLTGNVTIDATGMKGGQPFTIVFIQDATGGRTISWNAKFLFPNNLAPSVQTTANNFALFVSGEALRTGDNRLIANGWRYT